MKKNRLKSKIENKVKYRLKSRLKNKVKNRLKRTKNRLKKEEKEEKTIPDWVLVKEPVFKRIYNTVDESVKNKLTTKGDNKRITTIALQHFLQDIVNKCFNSGNDDRNWLVKNILYNYERGVRNVDSNKAKKIMDIYEEVGEISIPPALSTHDEIDEQLDVHSLEGDEPTG